MNISHQHSELQQAASETAAAASEELYLPPRKKVHPTEKEKWLPIFYRTLLSIFVLLTIGLLVWGWYRDQQL
ncbi:hypothetical protein [Paenibacillus sp. YYML68]|uniref:hypothetical protein n=1 Tax=Paenibacillus sp. YYML68 TaxID=2909250 RepID=UPI0024936DE3|nr:hypothetical protein [Paenibacillus sp. YYML68]